MLAGAVGTKSPDRTTPLAFASVEEYIRLLREAQRDESKESSRVASLTSTRKNSPRGSPKSPPNSPNTELAATEEDLRNVYINYVNKVTLLTLRAERVRFDKRMLWAERERERASEPVRGEWGDISNVKRKLNPLKCTHIHAPACWGG